MSSVGHHHKLRCSYSLLLCGKAGSCGVRVQLGLVVIDQHLVTSGGV